MSITFLAWGSMYFRQSVLVIGMYVEHCSVGKGFLQAPSLSLKGIIAMWHHTSSTKSAQTLILLVPLGSGYTVPPYHTPPHCTGQKEMDMLGGAPGICRASLSLCGTTAWLWVNACPHKTSTSDTIRSAVLVLYRTDLSGVPTCQKYL